MFVNKQAEKLKSREMKEGCEEWWMLKDEWWRMMISSCWGVLWLTDRQTNERTFVNVESLSRLKILSNITWIVCASIWANLTFSVGVNWSVGCLELTFPTKTLDCVGQTKLALYWYVTIKGQICYLDQTSWTKFGHLKLVSSDKV